MLIRATTHRNVLVGYGDNLQSHGKSCSLFKEILGKRAQISGSTVVDSGSKIETNVCYQKFTQMWKIKIIEFINVSITQKKTTTEKSQDKSVSQLFNPNFHKERRI